MKYNITLTEDEYVEVLVALVNQKEKYSELCDPSLIHHEYFQKCLSNLLKADEKVRLCERCF